MPIRLFPPSPSSRSKLLWIRPARRESVPHELSLWCRVCKNVRMYVCVSIAVVWLGEMCRVYLSVRPSVLVMPSWLVMSVPGISVHVVVRNPPAVARACEMQGIIDQIKQKAKTVSLSSGIIVLENVSFSLFILLCRFGQSPPSKSNAKQELVSLHAKHHDRKDSAHSGGDDTESESGKSLSTRRFSKVRRRWPCGIVVVIGTSTRGRYGNSGVDDAGRDGLDGLNGLNCLYRLNSVPCRRCCCLGCGRHGNMLCVAWCGAITD